MVNARTIQLRIQGSQLTEAILNDVLLPAAHMKNMLIILYQNSHQDLKKLWLKADVLRAVLFDRKGGKKGPLVEKLRQEIQRLPKDLREIYQNLYDQAQHFDAKHIYKLVKNFIGEMRGYFTKTKKGEKANQPRPRKLRTLSNLALGLDKERVYLKDDGFHISIGLSRQLFVPFDLATLKSLVDPDKIKNYRLSTDGRNFSLDVGYEKPPVEKTRNLAEEKVAGMDPGVNNLASILVLDDCTSSVVISGGEFTAYNQLFNKKKAKLYSQKTLANNARLTIEEEVWELLEENSLSRQDEQEIAELVEEWHVYKADYQDSKKELDRLYAKRKDFLDTNLKKTAKAILKQLEEVGVTTLVTSRDVLKAKQKTDMGKVNNQKFVNIPFATLIDTLKLHGAEYGIEVIDHIKEAYTSKTNSLYGDVIAAQKLMELDKHSPESQQIRATAFQGRRRKSEFSSKSGHIFHADLNGALNIIVLYLGDQMAVEHLKLKLFKLCNPIVYDGRKLYNWLDKPLQAGKTLAV